MKPCTTETEAAFTAAQEAFKPTILTATSEQQEISLLASPSEMTITSLRKFVDEALPAPRRRTGTATLGTIESFIAHVNRFKDAGSVVFARSDRAAPSLLSVLDYHHPTATGGPRFGGHRGQYLFPLSEVWQAWASTAVAGMFLSQERFADFIESRIADVLPAEEAKGSPAVEAYAAQLGCEYASPARLMALSRGLAITVGRKVANKVNLQSGEGEISFTEEHSDAQGAPLKVPGALLIRMPVFRGGAAYKVPVRLRYRVAGGAVGWNLELQRTDVIFDDAFNEAVDAVRKETELPVLFGAPES